MSTTSEIAAGATRGLAPLIGIGALAGVIYLFRNQIAGAFMGTAGDVVESVSAAVEPVSEASKKEVIILEESGETITAGEVAQMGAGITGLIQGEVNILGKLWNEYNAGKKDVVASPDIVYQPSKVSEYVATNAYLPGVTLLPENQSMIWRPKNELVGQIRDVSEFTGKTDIYDIIKPASSTGNSELMAVRQGAGLSEGGIGISAWDTVFKKGTYEAVYFPTKKEAVTA